MQLSISSIGGNGPPSEKTTSSGGLAAKSLATSNSIGVLGVFVSARQAFSHSEYCADRNRTSMPRSINCNTRG